MGAYLDTPVTAKHTDSGSGHNSQYAVSSMQGWRRNMEDDHVTIPEIAKNAAGEFISIYAVFDGHGGAEVAKFAHKYYPRILSTCDAFKSGDYSTAMIHAFQTIDDMLETSYYQMELKVLIGQASDADLMEMARRRPASRTVTPRPTNTPLGNASAHSTELVRGGAGQDAASKAQQDKMNNLMLMKRQAQGGRVAAGGGAQGDNRVCELPDHPVHAGCTAVAVLQVGKRLFTANCGDSRAVVGRGGRAVPLSFDHKPADEVERNRIVQAGGFITEAQGHFRINGNLNLSRSLGDLKYKQNPQCSPAQQMITANPDITTHQLDPADDFMIIACDGVWDVLSNEEAVRFVHDRLAAGQTPGSICEQVFDRCIATNPRETRGIGGDNMTCLIVQFKEVK
jgi:protein phosphatase 1G